MVSGYGYRGGRGRCYGFWQDFMACMNTSGNQRGFACQAQAQDYTECLHGAKINGRFAKIGEAYAKQKADGKLSADVDALLTTDIAAGYTPKATAVKTKAEMSLDELQKLEEEQFNSGPMQVLVKAIKNNNQVMVFCRNNKKLLGRVRAFDRHCNLVLEDVKEMWLEIPKAGKGKKKSKPIPKDRYISKMFLRGDSVILVLRNPSASDE